MITGSTALNLRVALAQVQTALLETHAWVRSNGWAGYDPYDIHHWYLQLPAFVRTIRYVRFLAALPLRLEERAPYATRLLLRTSKRIYPQAMGLFTLAYARMYNHFRQREFLLLARECAQWLENNVSTGFQGYGWGLPIDYQSRILIPRRTPCGIVSVMCGEGFWELYRLTADQHYLDCSRRICEGFLRDLRVDDVGGGAVCFSYTPIDHFHVHNANLWIATYLVKLGQHLTNSEYVDYGLRAAQYALADQREDGSLTYWGSDPDATGPMDHYHSGFEIRALHSLWKLTGRDDFRRACARYYDYYKDAFLSTEGVPWRNPFSEMSIDIYGCAEALLCNAQLSQDFPSAGESLVQISTWVLDNMRSPRGHFLYQLVSRDGRNQRLDVPYIRWGQATMMCGLVYALEALERMAK